MSQALDDIEKIISAFDNIVQQYEWNFQEVNDCDNETNDLLHEIELTELSAKEQRMRYRQLKEVRERRRKAKNAVEQYKELYEFIKAQEDFYKQLKLLRSKIKKIIDYQAKQVYTPRIRTDLKCTTLKPFNSKMEKVFKNAN